MGILNQNQSSRSDNAANLYAVVTSQARQRVLFHDYQVPDTLQGRFEMLVLHLSLMLRRLKFLHEKEGEAFRHLSQELCDWVVADLEESLRSMRISERKVPHHLKSFMEGFYGRLIAYDKALESNDNVMLEQAIRRNVYGIVDKVSDEVAKCLVIYVRQAWNHLEKASMPEIFTGLTGEM